MSFRLVFALVLSVTLLSAQAVKENERKEPNPAGVEVEPAKIVHGPWLAHPNVDSMTIGFTTTRNCGGGVEYREKGAKDWKAAWDTIGGQINKLHVQHPVHLTGLKPDTEYEYRILIFKPYVRTDVRSKEARVKQVITLENPAWHFRTFASAPQDYHFTLTSDLQFSNKGKRGFLTAGYNNCGTKDARFFVNLGDSDDNFANFDVAFMQGIVDPLTSLNGSNCPTIFVRGNHEWRGGQCVFWCDYFGTPVTRLSYYSFRCGEAFYIVLDPGEDQHAGGLNFHYTGINADNNAFMDKQADWLDTVVASEPFKTAKYRIIFAHGAIYSHPEKFMHDATARILRGHFTADKPAERIHLWLAGHTHNYSRTVPGKDYMYWMDDTKKPVYPQGNYPFPVVTNDGPGFGGLHNTFINVAVTKDRLTVKALGSDGLLLDCFEILPDGSCVDKNDGSLKAKQFPYKYLK